MKNRNYDINEFSEKFINNIRERVFIARVFGMDVSGQYFEKMVAEGVKGTWVNSRKKIADVYNDNTAWSCKTEKVAENIVRNPGRAYLISGRVDVASVLPDDVHIAKVDPETIGEAALKIWNDRVYKAADEYEDIRTITMYRTGDLSVVSIWEELTQPYDYRDYTWLRNGNGIIEGWNKKTMKKDFRWQKSGTQLTIYSDPKDVHVIEIPDPISYPSKLDILNMTKYAEALEKENMKPEQLFLHFDMSERQRSAS